ncbi:MAG: glycosyl hydrolase, partial [Kiritimatiellales bacterium]
GPWIRPEYAMQKLTWSETQVTGGAPVELQLPRPTVLKTYKPEFFEPEKPLDWYRDVAVIAFPTPVAERTEASRPVITASDSGFNLSALNNDEPVPAVQHSGNFTKLSVSADRPGFLQWSYSEPFQAQTLRIEFHISSSASVTGGELFCSEDGQNWRSISSFAIRNRMPVNMPFAEESAKYWKVQFPVRSGNAEVRLMSAALLPGYRIADWTAKAMFDDLGMDKPRLPPSSLSAPGRSVISMNSIIDLTGKMDGEGRLKWDAPPGRWTVIRFGHTPTGMSCRPAAHGGGGLECDKFSPDAIDLQWDNAIGPYLKDPDTNPHFQYVYIDSWEVYAQNWSKNFPEQFRSRSGYDLRRWLPVMTGRVVESLEQSERFLWDVRGTVCGLMDGFFARMQELCARNGKQFVLEPYHQEQFNSTSAGTRADIPMCEVWRTDNVPPPFWAKLGSSPAHVSGKNLVACESFTSNTRFTDGGDWSKDFSELKLTADAIFCGGVNRMCFHVSVHQPWSDAVPGMTVGPCGQHFERTNPLWGKAKAFTDFVARSQYLLRQGLFAADILYSCGEDSPGKSLSVTDSLHPGRGYDYDICSPEIITARLAVRDGRLVLPDGLQYRLLVLPESDTMSLAMIRKLKELIENGATVIASKPERTASLAGGPESDAALRALAAEIWGGCDGKNSTEHRLGAGRVIWGKTVAQVLAETGTVPDFSAPVNNPAFPLLYIHRQTEDGTDIYYVANTDKQPVSCDCTFRVARKIPELWNPVTGEIRRLPEFRREGQTTVVPMMFDRQESFFVVFKPGVSAAPAPGRNFPELFSVQELKGSWTVSFDPVRGGPASAVFNGLTDWSSHSDSGIKYYSGSAVYSKSFDFEKPAKAGRIYLDLGSVKNVASVRLNGKQLGTVWSAPWRVEVTGALQATNNQLEIEITNLLPNRMIGDEQLPPETDCRRNSNCVVTNVPAWLAGGEKRASRRFTFATFNPYTKDSPLLPSGLLGPVVLRYEAEN